MEAESSRFSTDASLSIYRLSPRTFEEGLLLPLGSRRRMPGREPRRRRNPSSNFAVLRPRSGFPTAFRTGRNPFSPSISGAAGCAGNLGSQESRPVLRIPFPARLLSEAFFHPSAALRPFGLIPASCVFTALLFLFPVSTVPVGSPDVPSPLPPART